jgi:hypothetical protein
LLKHFNSKRLDDIRKFTAVKPLRAACFCFFLFAFTGTVCAENAFLGSIPVQYVVPGQELVLDMHRFFQPAADVKLSFATKDDVDVAFDQATFQLRARAKKIGLSDVQLFANAGKKSLSGILTLAAAPPQSAHHFAFKPNFVGAAIPSGGPERSQTPLPAAETAASTTKVYLAGIRTRLTRNLPNRIAGIPAITGTGRFHQLS